MSANAASLSCPVCSLTGVFNSVQSLRDRLIYISTNKISCPVCQEEVSGLDKLTIHLFSHVKLLTVKGCQEISGTSDFQDKLNSDNTQIMPQQKKPKATVNKNKTLSPINTPVKFVKIFPKLPVISLNTVPVLDISLRKDQVGEPMYVKTEGAIVQVNTTCNICGLQFIDANILRMHRCLIHNIDENSDQNFTRYHCHLCPKNFKMRGSLMVHLRVAHFGFLSGNGNSDRNLDKVNNESNLEQQDEKPTNLERSDNKQWQCEVCRKCFTTKYFLKKHKRLHTGETPYACAQCNKTFTFQQSYHKHLLYHNDEKPHTCTYCGRAFKELSTLHNHQRIHTGEKPFSCETCGKCFRQRVSYLVHRRIHTGVMPYKCTACQKSFRYKVGNNSFHIKKRKVSQRTHKCQAQPPGTVVRQSGELVEKLKKKHDDPTNTVKGEKPKLLDNLSYTDVSEANAELVRTGAKLSLEDMESEHFSLIADIGENGNNSRCPTPEIANSKLPEAKSNEEIFNNNIESLMEAMPIEDKDIPSPSDILKNLCLSKEEDYIGILRQEDNDKSYDVAKDFNIFL